MNRICIGVLALATILTSACGIKPDSKPRDVPLFDREFRQALTGFDSGGIFRVYLVSPNDNSLLRSVRRDATSRQNLIEVLLAGPNEDEAGRDYSSVIPASTELISTRSQGNVLFIDISADIMQLSVQGLRLALAQIVFTASELEGVQAVSLTVEGEQVAWPRRNGESIIGPLQTYDFPEAVQTAQPDYPAVPSDAVAAS